MIWILYERHGGKYVGETTPVLALQVKYNGVKYNAKRKHEWLADVMPDFNAMMYAGYTE